MASLDLGRLELVIKRNEMILLSPFLKWFLLPRRVVISIVEKVAHLKTDILRRSVIRDIRP